MVPADHHVRDIARVVDLSCVRIDLAAQCSRFGRPSTDPKLIICMLLLGYLFAIPSEIA